MKKLVFYILIALPAAGFAQESQVDSFIKKYSGKQGFTTITFTKEMFELYRNSGNSTQDKGSANASAGINSMKMLTVSSDTTIRANFSKELRAILPKNKYKELMVIQDGNSTITFLVRQEGKMIKEFIMTIDGASPLLIYMEGDMDIDQLSKLSESMDIRGLDQLENIDEKK
jgi:hypothetical protein